MDLSRSFSFRSLWWSVRIVLLAGGALTVIVFAVLALRPVPDGVAVLVSKEDLPAGQPIDLSAVRVLTVDPQAVPADALREREKADGIQPPKTISAQTILTSENLGTDSEGSAIPSGFAQIVITVPPEQAFVATGDLIEVWGSPNNCDVEDCPIEKIADNVSVREVHSVNEEVFGGSEEVQVKLVVPAAKLGEVLHSASLYNVRFVMRSPNFEE